MDLKSCLHFLVDTHTKKERTLRQLVSLFANQIKGSFQNDATLTTLNTQPLFVCTSSRKQLSKSKFYKASTNSIMAASLEYFPPEVLEFIFKFLKSKGLENVSMVSIRWNQIVVHNIYQPHL